MTDHATRCSVSWWTLSLFLLLRGQPAVVAAEGEAEYLALPETFDSRPFLRYEQPSYSNFAWDTYGHQADHSFPSNDGVGFQNRPQAFYSRFGDFLTTGYELYSWEERRQPGQLIGSNLFKDWTSWHYVFDQLMVGHDSHRSWGYSLIVGDGLIARFTPLTLSKTDFNGARLDLSTPYFKLTTLASRIARPNAEVGSKYNLNRLEERTVNSTMLLGSRAQADIGALQIGLNGVNLHSFHALGTNNSIRGIVRPDHPLLEVLIVRFSDDSPGDGRGGAVVQEVELIIDGHRRPDIRPGVIRHRIGTATQVGKNLASGFLPINYNRFEGVLLMRLIDASRLYRDQELPLYADYLYRLAHEDPDFLVSLQNGDSGWVDRNADFVEKNTNLEGLKSTFTVESPDDILAADGTDALVYVFDLSVAPSIESVAVEAVVGNDYRVEVAKLYQFSERPGNLHTKYRSTPYETVLRAEGNVRDQSNIERVGFDVGTNTSLFTYSADLHLRLPGLEITGEYARSATFARFPSHVNGTPDFHSGPRFSDKGSAFFLNGTSWFGRGRIGFELFAMNPDFTTDMVAYLPRDPGHNRGLDPFFRLDHSTMVWRLVQDNEDGDRWPDLSLGPILGSPGDRPCLMVDCDGTFPGQDVDNDGITDTNRNLNSLPDYKEPFLMYDVDPNDFVYGMDRNNNDEPDFREDDYDADYPYDYDQRGYHFFGQYDLTPHWTVGVGRHDVEGVAGGGRNNSTYALLTYQRQGLERVRQVFFENHFRRVEDDIPDEYNRVREDIEVIASNYVGIPNTLSRDPIITRPDLLLYEDSDVNETYLEGHWRPWSSLNVVQKLRLRLNWQQEGLLPSGTFQRARRLDQWNVVSRADYTRYWGSLKVQPQFKFMLLRLRDQRAERSLRSEVSLIPILRAEYPLMSRSTLQVGIQGIGPFPYRFEDRVADRNSFERRTKFVNLTNQSSYFGYELFTIIGLTRDKQDFDDDFQRFREFDTWSFFIRAVVGFTQYGRPL